MKGPILYGGHILEVIGNVRDNITDQDFEILENDHPDRRLSKCNLEIPFEVAQHTRRRLIGDGLPDGKSLNVLIHSEFDSQFLRGTRVDDRR